MIETKAVEPLVDNVKEMVSCFFYLLAEDIANFGVSNYTAAVEDALSKYGNGEISDEEFYEIVADLATNTEYYHEYIDWRCQNLICIFRDDMRKGLISKEDYLKFLKEIGKYGL